MPGPGGIKNLEEEDPMARAKTAGQIKYMIKVKKKKTTALERDLKKAKLALKKLEKSLKTAKKPKKKVKRKKATKKRKKRVSRKRRRR